jgi:hypothetical protein
VASGRGLYPLGGGRRFARAAIPCPTVGDRSLRLDDAVADYLFGAAAAATPAELQANRLPDVDGGFRWTLQFRTNVLTAWDGSEQRIATHGRSRDSYDGSFFLPDTDTRYIRSLLSRQPASTVELPMPHEAVAAVAAVTTGTIVVDTDYVDWAAIGRRVYVLGPAGDAYTATISGVDGDTLNLDSSPPVGGSFPAGATHVYPVETVYLNEGQTLSRWPVNAARWSFAARASVFRALVGTGAELTMHYGLPVLHLRPRASGRGEEQVASGVEIVDQGGTFTATTGWSRSAHRRTHESLVTTPAERQWWKLFLAATRGRWKSFLCPTWQDDLPLYSQPSNGDGFLQTTEDYLAEWWPSLAHRQLQIEYADGSVSYRAVVSAADDDDAYQTLTLGAALPDPLPAAVRRVSFLETCRLDTDEPSIEYGAGWRGRIQLPIVTVQEEAPGVYWPETAAEMAEVAGYGTWSSAWFCDEASGDLADAYGAVTLAAASSPVYRDAGAFPGDYAIGFNSASDRFEAASSASYDLDASTSLAVYMCLKIASGSDGYILGKVAAGASWVLRNLDPNDHILVALVGGGSMSATVAVAHNDGLYHDVLMTIDRTNQRAQVFTDLGESAAVDISSVGSMSNAQVLHLGATATAAAATPHSVAFVAIATGDVPALRAHGAEVIAAMRAFTGRS